MRVRESWRLNKDCNILTPIFMAISVMSFSFSRAAQPEAQGPTLLAFSTASYHQLVWSPNSIGVPEGPFGRVWLSLPHLIYNSSDLQLCQAFSTTSYQQLLWTPTLWLPVLTELYNSSTPTQSPTQSLEWHVWSLSSGNNCHAVHRSLSSSASVYECTIGILPCPILLAKSTYAISPHKWHRNVSLPSGASLWNGKFGGVEGQNTTL